ncbi:FIG016502: iron uptake protein [plant metagenome]|uniref:FIG016502: iron uptake protein n=1 Tax=plant metagenome TaxID=1297885 RepID=A0A484Q0Z5_9ZZZZ
MIVLALLLCAAGFASLALAMDRHRTVLTPRPLDPLLRTALRAAGVLHLAAALPPCIDAWGLAQGVVGWFGALSFGAAVVVLVLRYAPARRNTSPVPPRKSAP